MRALDLELIMQATTIPLGSIGLQTPDIAVGRVRCNGGAASNSPIRALPTAVLWIPYAGAYRWTCGPTTVTNANHCCFIPSQAEYRTTHFLDCPDATLWLTLSDQAMEETGLARCGDPVAAMLSTESRRRAASIAYGMLHAGDTLELEEHAWHIVTSCRSLKETVRPGCATTLRLIDRAKEYLSAAANRSISLSEIGSAVGASPVYLTQLFSATQGIPLYRYHSQLRTSAAASLLSAGMRSTDVAFTLGYASHSRFCEAFRRAFGVNPTGFGFLPGSQSAAGAHSTKESGSIR